MNFYFIVLGYNPSVFWDKTFLVDSCSSQDGKWNILGFGRALLVTSYRMPIHGRFYGGQIREGTFYYSSPQMKCISMILTSNCSESCKRNVLSKNLVFQGRKVKNFGMGITLKRSTQQLFSVKYLFGKQILLRISYYLRTTKNL